MSAIAGLFFLDGRLALVGSLPEEIRRRTDKADHISNVARNVTVRSLRSPTSLLALPTVAQFVEEDLVQNPEEDLVQNPE